MQYQNIKILVFFLAIFFFRGLHLFCADSIVTDFVDTYQSNLKELKEGLDIIFKKSLGRRFGEWLGLTSDSSCSRRSVRWHVLELIGYLEERGIRERLSIENIREPIFNLFRSYKKPLDVYEKQLNELWDAFAYVSVHCRHYSRKDNERFVANVLALLMREVGIRV